MKALNSVAAALVGAAALPASAANFDFYKLGNGATDFLPSDGIACTGGDSAVPTSMATFATET